MPIFLYSDATASDSCEATASVRSQVNLAKVFTTVWTPHFSYSSMPRTLLSEHRVRLQRKMNFDQIDTRKLDNTDYVRGV